ncbi:YeeE/YedE family protein [Methylobacterium tardum]
MNNYRSKTIRQGLFRRFRSATTSHPAAAAAARVAILRVAIRGRAMGTYLPALAGGLLIGLSATLLLLLNGRIAGISGLVAGLGRPGARRWTDAAFLLGLALGPPLFALLAGQWPQMRIAAGLPVLALAGLLVGFGTRLGSGCTSGHGVCGLARLSPRSIVAVLVFLATGMLTVAAVRGLA